MSRLADIRSQLNQRGKSVVSYGADLVEWSAEKNLAVAGDIASFAVAQIRLPIEVQGFAEYRTEVQQSVSDFGEMLKEHGEDYVARLREVPGEFRKVVKPETEALSGKTTAKKRAAPKKVAPKKAAPKKTAAKKAVPKRAA
ncbi:MAG: hypothetical protein WBM61_18325 [Woeseiaceae bacterium]